jgi:lysophospholipase L1-like esterase
MSAGWLVLVMAASVVTIASAAAPLAFEVKEADRVIVSVGSGFIEQEQFYGFVESTLARRFPGRQMVCRNLGWSGDTVWGTARTRGYQNPAGFDRLKKQVAELKPDLILVGYGSVESFDGPAGLDHFKQGYNSLLDTLATLSGRLVLLSPPCHEDLGRPLPDPAAHNANLEAYTQAIEAIAHERHVPFVDLFRPTLEAMRVGPHTHLTSNGILLNETGYWLVAQEVAGQLGLRPMPCRIEFDSGGKLVSAANATVTDVKQLPGWLQFRVVADLLPAPPATEGLADLAKWAELSPVLRVRGLAAGEWELRIDGKNVLTETAMKWDEGVAVGDGPDIEQVRELRRLVVSRNELFYRRWNPTNDIPQHYTYIAPDYAMYDARVAELDKLIAKRSKAVAHLYELSHKLDAKP